MGNCVISNSNNGRLKLDLLWTNSSPTSEFTAQTVSITNLSKYNIIVINVVSYIGGELANSLMLRCATGTYYLTVGLYNNLNAVLVRSVSWSNDSLSFGSGKGSNSSTINNS